MCSWQFTVPAPPIRQEHRVSTAGIGKETIMKKIEKYHYNRPSITLQSSSLTLSNCAQSCLKSSSCKAFNHDSVFSCQLLSQTLNHFKGAEGLQTDLKYYDAKKFWSYYHIVDKSDNVIDYFQIGVFC